MSGGMRIAFFGSSLLSSYWNGAATYYRGIVKALARRGHRITFLEPDAFDRQHHRDIEEPEWARVVVWPAAGGTDGAERALASARGADLVVKASGVGAHDAFLEREVLRLQSPSTIVAFWDVDAPATLERVAADPADPFRALVPRYDLVLTYGGGAPVTSRYAALGARACVPIYNAHDPETHHPVPADPRFAFDVAFLGNRLPDREERVRSFLFTAADALAGRTFAIGGAGWRPKDLPANVRALGHVGTADHNAFHCTPRAVLSINRASMARFGWSPATRIFEAAAAGACTISDVWPGIEDFYEPETEILLAASGAELAERVRSLDAASAARIGERARARSLAHHCYSHRALELEAALASAPMSLLQERRA